MQETQDNTPTLKRELSLTLVTFYGIGTILGAGIYVLVGKVAGLAGMATPVAFLLASIVAAFSALSYAELSARFPKSAGEAVYVQHGFNIPAISILVGLSIILVGATSVATLVHGFTGYLAVFLDFPPVPVMIGLILAMGAIVGWGIGQSVLIASLMTLVEMAGLLLILWIGRGSFSDVVLHLPEMIPSADSTVWAGILLGSVLAFYAFIGFEDIVNVAEEVRQPERNLPRAIVLALTITTLFYFLVAALSIVIIPPDELAKTDAPLAEIYQQVTGQTPVVITLISLVSVLNGALVQIIMASRVLYGMSRQGWMPARFGDVHAITQTPIIATLTVVAIILIFTLLLPLVSLARLTSFITLLIFATINLSLIRIKIRSRLAQKTFTVPLPVPILGLLTSSGLVLYQAVSMFT